MATPFVAPKPAVKSPHAGAVSLWHDRAAEVVAREVGSDTRRGLPAAEAEARSARDGRNMITAKKGRAWWLGLLLQCHAPLVYILMTAAGVKVFLGEYIDSGVIFGAVLANAIIGFVKESKVVKAIDALSRSLRIQATVFRDGQLR